jgi:hypothetical protein
MRAIGSLAILLALACCGFAQTATTVPAKPSAEATRYLFGVLGRTGKYLEREYAAGVRAKVLEFSWKEYFPAAGSKNAKYVDAQKQRLADWRGAGFQIVLNIGANDAPLWVHVNYRDTRYLNQFAAAYEPRDKSGAPMGDSGDVNFVFNPEMRRLQEQYIAELFADFPEESFDMVRIGGGRYGEVQYPLPSVNGRPTYWAFDAKAQASCPVPGWKPGQASPNGEAEKFINWYFDALVDYQNWQIHTVRKYFHAPRPLLVLYPNWGTRPGWVEEAVAHNLDGSTLGERKGQLALGLDFARLVKAIHDRDAWVCCTCINKSDKVKDSPDPRHWGPVHYLSSLADAHPLKLNKVGENAGPAERFYMEWTASQMKRYGLRGMFWAFEYQLFDTSTEWEDFASIDDYRDIIRQYNGEP